MGGRADLRAAAGRPLHLLRRQGPAPLGPGRSDAEVGPQLAELWKHNYSVYGRRKLWKAAQRAGIAGGRDQVARLMALHGIRGATRAKKRFTTKADPTAVRAPDLVNRDFTADRPDALWVADFTYCSTWSGIVYVAFIIDVYSRRLVGWKAARSMTAPLVVDALNMAAWSRRHTTFDGLVCHTDAGSQKYTSLAKIHIDCLYRATRRRRRRYIHSARSATAMTVSVIPGLTGAGNDTGKCRGRGLTPVTTDHPCPGC